MPAVLILSIGPVQEFIRAGRRMRDVWFGSHLLSELARAAARSLHDCGLQLVFPAFTSERERLTCRGMWRDDGGAPQAVANRILAVSPQADADFPAIVDAARREIVATWCDEFARPAVDRAWPLLRQDIVERGGVHTPAGVIEDFLEVLAAWAGYTEGDGEYIDARRRAERLLAGRKTHRDFAAWPGDAGRYKSSMDGARESILREERDPLRLPVSERADVVRTARTYRVDAAENLDALGVVKRMGGEPDQFVPVVRVALAPWISAIERRVGRGEPRDRDVASAWSTLAQACRAGNVPRVDARAAAWIERGFPFDAELFLEGRWDRLDYEDDGDRTLGHVHAARFLRALRASPHPYVACLRADGDRMGRALDSVTTATKHIEVSQALSEFARAARGEIEARQGILIFSGGDDVLAVLPVETALACGAALQALFAESVAARFSDEATRPTLSVGVAVAHVLTPLGEVLELAGQAEQHAKQGDDLPEADTRNALAVLVDKRGGGTALFRASWNDDPIRELEQLATDLAEGAIPVKLPSELEALLRRMPEPSGETGPDWAAILATEVSAIVTHKDARIDGGLRRLTTKRAGLTGLDSTDYVTVRRAVGHWVAACKVARMIGEAQRASRLAATSARHDDASADASATQARSTP